MKRGLFTVGMLLGAGALTGAAVVYSAATVFAWLAAVVWINLDNPALYVLLAAVVALVLFSTKQKAAPKDGL